MTTIESLLQKKDSIVVVGLGYVGLPLACGLAEHFRVYGFDLNAARVDELKSGIDRTGEVDAGRLSASTACFTTDPAVISEAAVVIVAVPTPIDRHRRPDFTPLVSASKTVGHYLRCGAIVVYESTVYPGATEEVCVPILESESGLRLGRDFSVGYSPERINPGDKVHTVENIIKIVSASDIKTRELLAQVYGSLVKAGVYQAGSIRVAEAAKVIENTQRDLNIALMNELSMIFEKMGIDTLEVLAAAETKWNFLPFRPGLVGGHCIGVDPYYLTFKAQEQGYLPEIILAGRRINDSMGKYVAEICVKKMIAAGCLVRNGKVGIMGLTFKENVPDLRNSKVVDIINELEEYGVKLLVHDPLAEPESARAVYQIELTSLEDFRNLDALILAVPHDAYRALTPAELKQFFASPDTGVLLDLKGFLERDAVLAHGMSVWRL